MSTCVGWGRTCYEGSKQKNGIWFLFSYTWIFLFEGGGEIADWIWIWLNYWSRMWKYQIWSSDLASRVSDSFKLQFLSVYDFLFQFYMRRVFCISAKHTRYLSQPYLKSDHFFPNMWKWGYRTCQTERQMQKVNIFRHSPVYMRIKCVKQTVRQTDAKKIRIGIT